MRRALPSICLLYTSVIPQIKRIEGVGDVMELGDTYSMRIWLKPERKMCIRDRCWGKRIETVGYLPAAVA